MIKAILVFNNHGKPRLSKFYQYFNEDMQQQIIKETFQLVSKRDDNVCNFLEGGSLIGGSDYKLIYRHYATLYFVFCVDSSESELGILDLIQVFVETLDKCFENVCELDLIFHADAVHHILAELVMGGMVLQTNMSDILARIEDQNKIIKQEAGLSAAPARAVSAVKSMNLPQQFKEMKLPDLPQAIKEHKEDLPSNSSAANLSSVDDFQRTATMTDQWLTEIEQSLFQLVLKSDKLLNSNSAGQFQTIGGINSALPEAIQQCDDGSMRKYRFANKPSGYNT